MGTLLRQAQTMPRVGCSTSAPTKRSACTPTTTSFVVSLQLPSPRADDSCLAATTTSTAMFGTPWSRSEQVRTSLPVLALQSSFLWKVTRLSLFELLQCKTANMREQLTPIYRSGVGLSCYTHSLLLFCAQVCLLATITEWVAWAWQKMAWPSQRDPGTASSRSGTSASTHLH